MSATTLPTTAVPAPSTGVVPVPTESLPDFYKRAIAARKREDRRGRSYTAVLMGGLALAVGYAGYLAWRNEELVRLAAENANRVVFVYTGENGTLHNSAAFSSLPVKYQTDNVLNTLWNYVWWRECWSQSEDPRALYVVQRMSNEQVRREWLTYMATDNPLSPRNRLGKRGLYYTCEPISYTPVGSEGNRYSFRFMRYEHAPSGSRDRGISMTATVAYRTGVYASDENGWVDKAVFNAPGIQVWEYPGARPDAVQQHLVANGNQGGAPR